MTIDEEDTTPQKSRSSASHARARAQARRRRILEQGKDRINYVNGVAEAVPSASASDSSQPVVIEKPKNDDVVPSVEEDEEGVGGGGGDTTTSTTTPATTTAGAADTDAASPQPALTGAQRLAQARRRRYRKSTTTATSTDTTTSTTEGTAAATDHNGASMSTNTTTPDVTETTTDESTEPTRTATTAVPTGTTTETKKKYLGVAKVRRKLIAEKKASESHLNNTTSSAASAERRKNRQAYSGTVVPTLPVFFQLLTVLTLFFIGFDAGLYNHYTGSYQTVNGAASPKVITTIGVLDNGYGLLSTLGLHHRSSSATPTDITSMVSKDNTVLSGEVGNEFITNEEEDEFATTASKPLGASSKKNRVANIDPLFHVDLDELTDHPGILMFFCRLAVRFHRCLTYLFYGLPKSVLEGIVSFFRGGFISSFRRPILFVLAVMVRTIGRRVFGASSTVPDLDETLEKRLEVDTGIPGVTLSDDNDGDPTGKKKKTGLEQLGNMDLMAMGTSYVTKFFETNFPKTMAVYGMFRYAKEDMYVVLCGFFLGMVLPVRWLSVYGMNGVVVDGDGDGMGREEL